MGEITQLLSAARAGEPAAQEVLFSRIYGELSKLARSKLSGAGALTLLDAPSLVHEVYLRLTRQEQLPAGNSHMFYGYAASIMRSVIVDYVRQRGSAKRGQGVHAVTLVTSALAQDDLRNPDMEKLDDALQDLDRVDERCRQIVEMRYFSGMSVEEVAGAMDLSPATVKRDWQKARAFLLDALHPG